MRKEMKEILGSEYSVAIEREINTLKPQDRMLCGDIMAVVKRSDANMGRPLEDCDESNEITYVIMEPSKYSIVSQKNIGAIRCENGNFVIMSVNYFVDQLLEFNFTYLQILYCGEVLYANAEYWKLRVRVDWAVNYYKEITFKKLLSMAHGITSDVARKKYENKQLENRLFLLYKVVHIIQNYIVTGTISIDDSLDDVEYNEVVLLKNTDKINKLIGTFDTKLSQLKEHSKDEIKEIKITNTFAILFEITSIIMKAI